MKGLRIIVKGMVQGVGFRYFTKRTADSFGIKGWVRNLPDGSVETFAFADDDALKRFVEMLRQGPSNGRVDEVQTSESEVSANYDSFDITY